MANGRFFHPFGSTSIKHVGIFLRCWHGTWAMINGYWSMDRKKRSINSININIDEEECLLWYWIYSNWIAWIHIMFMFRYVYVSKVYSTFIRIEINDKLNWKYFLIKTCRICMHFRECWVEFKWRLCRVVCWNNY